MELKKRISGDLKEAMKSRDDFKVGTLRFLLSSIQAREIEKRGKGLGEELTDEEVMEVLKKEAKKRRESFEIYEKGGKKRFSRERKERVGVYSVVSASRNVRCRFGKNRRGSACQCATRRPEGFRQGDERCNEAS